MAHRLPAARRWLARLLLSLVLTAPAAAQEKPRLVLTTGGPIAPTHSLLFSDKGSRLFTAGGDKMVRVWDVDSVAGKDPRVELSQRIFWPVARGDRGNIYCLAVAAEQDLVAFAGLAAYDATGDIHVYRIGTGELVRVLGTRSGEDQHRRIVVGLEFAPDGRHLASVSEDGEVRVWNTESGVGSLVQPADGQISQKRPLCFLANERLALPLRDGSVVSGGTQYPIWKVGIYDISQPGSRTRVLPQPHQGALYALAADHESSTLQWASSDAVGNVWLWDGVTASRLRSGPAAVALTFGRTDQLFVGTRQDEATPSRLEWWDCDARRKLDETTIARTADCRVCAASRDGNYLAAFDGDQNEIVLWHLADAAQRDPQRPLSGAGSRVHHLSGSGKTPWQVGFERGKTYRLAVADRLSGETTFGRYGTFTRVFDLEQRQQSDLEAVADFKARDLDEGAGDWSIVRPGDEHGAVVELRRNDQRQARIQLDEVYQGRATAYCWLADGSGQLYGLAIGTDKQHGIFCYALPQNGQCRLLRYFRDHQGWITSLSLSHDGKYLASASLDQTIKIWSLEGIQSDQRAFRQQAAWGAVFQLRGGRLVASDVLHAGIAAQRGMQSGDIVEMLVYADNGRVAEAVEPRKMLSVLEENPIWQSLRVSYRRPDSREVNRRVITPAWEPLLTLLIDEQNNWALWTPEGYYEASAIGDEMYGWILNADRFEKPAFVPAKQLRKQLERPDVLRELLGRGSLIDALQVVDGQAPENPEGQVQQVVRQQPKVRITSPTHGRRFAAADTIDVVAEVQYPTVGDADRFDVRCYLNSAPLTLARRSRIDNTVIRYEWQSAPVSVRNTIKVVAEGAYEGARTEYISQRVSVSADAPDKLPYRLHLVTISGDDYPEPISDLAGGRDADRFRKAVEQAAGQFYEAGGEFALKESAVTPGAIEDLSQQLQARGLETTDLLVVYVAGHGVEYDGDYYFLPAVRSAAGDDQSQRLTREQFIRQYGISWQHIQAFCQVPCRKLFLIDTCRENITGIPRLNGPIRPLRESESLILTACESGHTAAEDRRVGGIFTSAVIECFEGRADGFSDEKLRPPRLDQRVDIFELRGYVIPRTQELAAKLPIQHSQKPWSSSTSIGDPIYLVKVSDE